tara:strand:- start:536 stop:856 length:321 start_codon:yes stop_codon:yes gene_type:complete
MRVQIKALSVNEAWKGRRFKTDKYKKYEKDMLLILPKMVIPPGKLELVVTFGLSSKLADTDNFLKQFIDCLQKRYNFNDRDIFRIIAEKVIVKKGAEYIDFIINEF